MLVRSVCRVLRNDGIAIRIGCRTLPAGCMFLPVSGRTLPDSCRLLPDILPTDLARASFDMKMTANVTARQAKDDSRDALESAVRTLVRQLQASADVDDTERAAMGITVPDRIKTTAISAVSTRPVGVVDTSQRLRHEIRFTDESTPTSRAKPDGVMGCEIWVKVLEAGVAAPVGADGLEFITLDTASPYTAEYDGANGGKTAHYMLRWVKKNGDKGPWSETVSATITA